MLIYTSTKSRAYKKATPLLRLFLPRLGFTRYVMQRSLIGENLYATRGLDDQSPVPAWLRCA